MSKPSAAHVFGWAEMHPGACCDCCYGYCPRGDWAPAPDGPILRFEWAGGIYADDGKFTDHVWRRQYLRVGKKAAGRELDGRTWDEYPEVTS